MIRTLFGELRAGRLGRGGYVGALLVIVLLWFLLAVGIGFAAGFADEQVGDALDMSQAQLAEILGGPVAILVAVVGGVLVFANFNISAKRWRGIGLPGWPVVVGVVVATFALQLVLGEAVASIVGLVAFVALLVVPNDAWPKAESKQP